MEEKKSGRERVWVRGREESGREREMEMFKTDMDNRKVCLGFRAAISSRRDKVVASRAQDDGPYRLLEM